MNDFSADPHFCSGDELRKHLRLLIETSSRIDIATAWVSDSNILKLLVSDGIEASTRMVVGVGGYMTDPVSDRNLQAFHYNVVAFGKQGHFAKQLQAGTRIKLVVQAQTQPDNIASIPLLTATFVRPVRPVARVV